MDFREITLDDQKLFDEFEYVCSDYVFSYLLMYRDLYNLTICEDNRAVIIRSQMKKPFFYMPLGNIEYGIAKIIDYCRKTGTEPLFAKIPEKYADTFKDFDFKLEEHRDSFDYIYKTCDLVNYDGKEFRKQRNNLSSYLKTFSPSYSDDIQSFLEECRAFTLANFDQKYIIGPTLKMLDNLHLFDCMGGIVRDRDTIQGFCITERVSDNTVMSHIELTDNSHRGIHAYMINEMSKRIEAEYINKQDDVGMKGLRRFKESYNPCCMLKKYTARII